MKKVLVFLCLALFITMACPLCMAQGTDEQANDDHVPFWWWGKNFTGVIANISDNTITLLNDAKDKKSFEITPRTKIILRDSKALAKGMLVKITYQEITSKRTAKAIRELKVGK